jgi:hypothetical protein
VRQLLLIASLVGLFMYTGFAVEYDPSVAGVARLEEAMSATGAALERVTISGWVRVPDQAARARAAAALAWGEGTAPGEARELKLYQQEGSDYLALRWQLSGGAKAAWWAKYSKARQALGSLGAPGAEPTVTVQLEGISERTGLMSLSTAALDALQATGRQPWGDARAASIAAQSPLLPGSTFGVNVQVAARRDPAGKRTRVWVAWPALQQEY